jgi:hypothetical protein
VNLAGRKPNTFLARVFAVNMKYGVSLDDAYGEDAGVAYSHLGPSSSDVLLLRRVTAHTTPAPTIRSVISIGWRVLVVVAAYRLFGLWMTAIDNRVKDVGRWRIPPQIF